MCPRQTAKRIVARAADQGYGANFGIEFEWFNFAESSMSAHQKGYREMEPISPGMFGYSVVRQATNQAFFDAMLTDLTAYGVPIEGLHCETGPGVLEVAILYSGDAIEAADRAVLFKSGCKEIGARLGILPTFMARWNTSLPGSSGHHHQSMYSLDDGASLFYDVGAEHSMSKLFRSYVAGQLKYLGDFLPMVAPTVNSYKRLVEGYWAPTRATWGIDNRTVALRVIGGGPSSTRLETRVPGADVNPYLGVAACYGAGLLGIEEGLTLDTEAIVGSGYEADAPRFPATLIEAAERFHASAAARDLFGDAFVDHFAVLAGVGVAPSPASRHRLGARPLLRGHLTGLVRLPRAPPSKLSRRGCRLRPVSIATFSFPTTIRFGNGARRLVGPSLAERAVARPLLVTDRGVAALQLHDEMLDALRAAGLEPSSFSEVWGNPVESQVIAAGPRRQSTRRRRHRGVGWRRSPRRGQGHRCARHPRRRAVRLRGRGRSPTIDDRIPYFVALPTTAGTGSEVGRSGAVIADEQTHIKRIVFSPHLLAKEVFADPELTVGLPANLTAATGMDALTHNIEAYLAKDYNPICDGIAIEGVRLCAANLTAAVHDGTDLGHARNVDGLHDGRDPCSRRDWGWCIRAPTPCWVPRSTCTTDWPTA